MMTTTPAHRCPALPPAVLIVHDEYTRRWVEWNRDGQRQMERVVVCRYCLEELVCAK